MDGNLTVKIFKPTVAEFDNPLELLKKIERDSDCRAVGLAKIIPPCLRRHTPIIIPDSFILKKCVAQTPELLSKTDVIQLLYRRNISMTLGEFKNLAKTIDQPKLSLAQRELNIWQNLRNTNQKKGPASIYGVDNEISRFPDNYRNWNLDNFQAGTILTGRPMPGINKSFLNYGMSGTYFGLHVEDSNMMSINMLHEGKPKTWYGIPAKMATKVENLRKSEISDETGCNLFSKHKTLLYHPSLLRDNGIDFCKVDQLEGEMIVTLYQAYHQGFNHGFNCSEAINFATPDWKKHYADTTFCSCRLYGTNLKKLHMELGKFLRNSERHWPSYKMKKSRSICENDECAGLTDVYCETCAKYLCFTHGESSRNCFYEFHRKIFPSERLHLPLHADQKCRSRCRVECHTPSNLTYVFCSECEVFLCLNNKRNCFKSYHLLN